MRKCLFLAEKGFGKTRSNPLVGALIEFNGQIIAEGYHQAYGQAHAEVNAINSVFDKSVLDRASLYVNLEPCSHHGKTPPCADFVINSGIKKIVIGALDPNPKVCGAGIFKLTAAGCEVQSGILERECKELNRRFYTFHEKQRPWIILKWAQSVDNFIAKLPAQRTRISCSESNELVHCWRSEEIGILVGTNTALIDDPELTSRRTSGINPTRIVLDKDLSLPKTLKMFNQESKTIIFSERFETKYSDNIEIIMVDFDSDLEESICQHLWKRNILSCMIEGGAKTLQRWIDKGLYDEARIFISPEQIGKGVLAPHLTLADAQISKIGTDTLYLIKHSDLYA